MGDFTDLFRHYWWLIFPVFGMVTGWLHMNQRHDQNLKVLDMIKSYTDQGKAPPPELLAALQQANMNSQGSSASNWMSSGRSEPNWIPFFLFAALAGGFAGFAFVEGGDLRHMLPFLFVALIMGAMAIGFLINMLAARNRAPR